MSGIFAATKQLLATGAFNWTSGTYSLMLVGPGYTPNYETDTTLANIPGGSQLLDTPVNLTGLTAIAGYCAAAPVHWNSLTSSAPVVGVAILLNNGGAQSTWELVCYADQGDGFGNQPSAQATDLVFSSQGIFRP